MKHANKVVRRSNIPVPQIERHIYTIRGQRVMLDRDLAKLYDVRLTALRQQVKRNPGRFPKDFMVQLKGPGCRTFGVTKYGSKRPHLPPIPGIRGHRTGRGDAVDRAYQRTRRAGE